MNLKNILQYSLCTLNITAAVVYPVLNEEYSIWVRVGGIFLGFIYVRSSSGIFEPIKQLNNQRIDLKKEVRKLESKIKLLERQIEEVATIKQRELDEREKSVILAEKELQGKVQLANQELSADKETFLKEQEEALAAYQSKIELLESRIDELERVLDEYEAPPLPEGSSFEIMIARKCMELLFKRRVICWFKGVSVDGDGYVVLRLKPIEGGQKAIEKWANHLHIEMELAENPKFATLRGAVQIWLKPQEMVRLPAIPDGNGYEPPPNHPSGLRYPTSEEGSPNLRLVKSETSQNNIETNTRQRLLENSYEFDERLERFHEPTAKLPPYGAIRQIERDWVGYLWIYHEPAIRNQKHIIFKVWGYKSGDGDGFQSARRRLHTILKDAGITPRTWRKTVGE